MNRTEKFFAFFFAMVGVGMIVPHLLLPLADAAETKAYIASWSAGAISLIAGFLAMKKKITLEQILAVGVVVGALCYLDNINHGVYLEETAKATAAAIQQ